MMALVTKPFRIEDYLKTPEDWAAYEQALLEERTGIPEGAMRVAPGTDAVVWRICPGEGVEL